MGSSTWLLLILCCSCVTGLQRWLQLTDYDCQGCNQYYDDSAMFTSMLFVSSDTLILGGRNTIHSIDMLTDTHTSFKDDFKTLETSVELCMNEGRIESDCQNYYKVLLMLSDTDIMSCGTWGYAPECDVRTVTALEFGERAHVRNGNGFCPANPAEPTSYLKLSGDIGFAGTCTDACTSDAITRFNLQPGSLSATSRTFDTKDMLSDPKFVYSFEEGDYVYFVFRETALELTTEKIYSRIGRICKNDVGSSSPLMQMYFTSNFKARFYCTSSQAGQQPFDHDEVDGAVYIERVLYAAFSGPKNLQTGSIVCSFPISVIDEVFGGPYLTFDKDNRVWVSSPNRNYSCSRKKEGKLIIQLYLMENSVYNLSPLFNTASNERLNSLTADSFSYKKEDIIVLYAASDNGKVHRVAFIRERDSNIYHTSYKVGEGEVQTVTYGAGHVYAMGTNWVTSIPVKQECAATSCGECVAAHYPYCGWCYEVTLGEWSCSTKIECPLRNWISPTDTCRALPTFYVTPKNLTLHEGATAQFKCESHDSQVIWSKDGARLPQKAGFINEGNMYIPEVRLEDTGFYECSVNNTSGVVVSKAYLYVQVPARFRLQPTNISVTFGHQDLVLTCRAEGFPKPEIWWERANGDLPDGSQQLANGDLKIIRVMKGDEGGYVCHIRNDVGGVSQSEPAYVTVMDSTDPYSPAADESSYESPISITVLTIGIVISAVVCFVIGLTVHMVYRRRKQKRDYIEEGAHHGTYSQFSGCPHQDDAGYLCPNQNWNNGTWQSFHHHHTGMSNAMSHGAFNPDTAMTNLMSDDEAPPAYSPGHNMNTLSDWYPSAVTIPTSQDYAEIMTIPLRPPPVSPPVLPPTAHMSPLPNCTTVSPLPRDVIPPGSLPGVSLGFTPSNMPLSRDMQVHSTVPVTASQQDGQNLNRLPPGLISDYSTKLQVSSAI